MFQQYVDKAWPRDSHRIGRGVVRASLYAKIRDVLVGGVASARLRQWVKRSDFFLTDENKLAVPVQRMKLAGRTESDSVGGKTNIVRNSSYRLVAQLEDFAHIIGYYHNDSVGHHGIKKTYAMVSLHTQVHKNHVHHAILDTCIFFP